jgi:drug/metabolite transporter (DMT)-like permease
VQADTRPTVAVPVAPSSSRSTFSAGDVGLFVMLTAMWGLSFLFIKVSVGALSPLWVVAGRTSIGGIVLLVILRLRGGRLPRGGAMWAHLLVLATIGNAVPWGLVAWAQQTIPSGLAAVVNSLVPASTLAVAAAVGVERLTVRRVVGLGLAIVGTLVIVGGELGAPGRMLSLVVVASATVMYGSATVYAKRFVSGRARPLTIAAGQVSLAAVLSVPLAWWVGPTPAWTRLGFPVVASMVVLGALGTGIAFLLYYLLIARVGPTNATMVTYLIPVVGLVAGAVLLDERFGIHVLLGGAVIVAGIWLAQRTAELVPAPRA